MFAAFGLSDPGCVRANNEDYFITDPDAGIFILADGMGGAKGGEHASRLSAESLHKFLLATGPPTGSADGLDTLERGFLEANWVVREAASGNPELEGMGTTLLAARGVAVNQLQLANVGDSRGYLSSGGHLSLVTRDQTWVSEVGTRLGLTDEALKTHPMRHVLTMAIGCGEELRVQSHLISLVPGDQILLCTDGLHGVVDEKTMASALLSEKSLDYKCHYLVEAAKRNGGPDNVTVVLIQHV
jgi:PPM family protein phosphatase